jgi:hypothetical protein
MTFRVGSAHANDEALNSRYVRTSVESALQAHWLRLALTLFVLIRKALAFV